jgi:excisionase family DNA binding protein
MALTYEPLVDALQPVDRTTARQPTVNGTAPTVRARPDEHGAAGTGVALLPAAPSLPLVLSVVEVASLLGISKDLTYDLVARGELPSLRFGRRVVVPTRPLLALLDGGGVPEALRRSS